MSSNSEFPWERVWSGSRYSSDRNRLRKAQRKFGAFRKMGILNGSLGRVLEIGCGNCTFIRIANQAGVKSESFIGIDKSESAIERAKENVVGIANCQLMTADACDLPIASHSVDTIIALGVLEHIADLDSCLQELARVSASGARLIISTSNTRSWMYLARLLRQSVGAWRYGFQKNDSEESLANRLHPLFEISKATSLHGDRDFIISTFLDKLLGKLDRRWGRYVLVEAKLQNSRKLDV